MRPQKNQNLLLILLALALFFVSPVKAQVTVGSLDPPHEFSILELVSNESGLRLPLLTEGERDNLDLGILTDPNIIEAAEGLVIFNTTSGCLEFWSGKTKGWISLCASIPPLGSKKNPYLILTPEQLDDVRNKPYAYYRVGQDIDLTSYLASNIAGWLPIGDLSSPFTGSIDGDKHTISGLHIQRPTSGVANIGLFGYINDGTVKDLKVELSGNINGGTGTYVGGLAGRISGNDGIISNCQVTSVGAGEIHGGNYVGGIVGRVDIDGLVTGCYTSVVVVGSNGVGGVVGQISSDASNERGGSVTNCYSIKDVTGTTGVGGVVGRVQRNGIVSNCYAQGAVKHTTGNSVNYVGGVVGRIDQNGKVSNCVALNSNVSTTFSTGVGRVTGYNDGGTLSNNWAFSNMIVTDQYGSVTTSGGAQNNLHGATIPSGSEILESWWTTAPTSGPGWIFNSNPWKWGANHPKFFWQ